MTRFAHRMPAWQHRCLVTCANLLLASGVVWLVVHYSIGAGTGELPHPAEAWSLRVHGLAAFAGLFMFGTLAGGHIPQGWRLSHRQRWAAQRGTGLALCSLGAALVGTGYLLYYFAPEPLRPALGWLHTALGLVAAAVGLWHGRRHGVAFGPTGKR